MPSSDLKQTLISQAKVIFENNLRQGYSRWKDTIFKFISPASKEYIYQWLWDTCFHSIVLSNFDCSWAKAEIHNLLLAQRNDGFIPHIIFWTGHLFNFPHWALIESALSLRPNTSAITQPPVIAEAVEAIYKKDPDINFLKQVLPKIAKFHRWLLENRDPDQDQLISIISPNESGMDELPVFQVVSNYFGKNSSRLHYIYRKIDLLNKVYRFNSKSILDKDYFNVEELLFNSVFLENCRILARLFLEINDKKEADFFNQIASFGEKSLFEKCWNGEDNIFYSLYSKKENQAKVKTIASLMPIYLSNIPRHLLKLLVEKHLLNESEFWTNFPIPSVAKDELYYQPTNLGSNRIYGTSLLWRGPTWINTNWFVIKGLRKHGYNEIADKIVEKMLKMIQKEGFREYYNPETGEGYRRENFGWSTLIVDLID